MVSSYINKNTEEITKNRQMGGVIKLKCLTQLRQLSEKTAYKTGDGTHKHFGKGSLSTVY